MVGLFTVIVVAGAEGTYACLMGYTTGVPVINMV